MITRLTGRRAPPNHHHGSRGSVLLVMVLLLLALAVVAVTSAHDSFWYDEYRSLFNLGGLERGTLSPAQIAQRIALENPWQAPLYYFLLAGWGAVAGWSEEAVRTLPLWSGLLAVALMYRLGRDLHSRRVGLFAALLLGGSAFFIYFLHENRAYTLVVLLTILLIDSYWRMVYLRGGALAFGVLVLSAAALPYTHYFSVPTVFALALYHVLFAPKANGWWRAPVALLLALVAFLPWLPVTLNATLMAGDDARRFQTLSAFELAGGLLTQLGNSSPALLLMLLVAGLATAGRYVRFAAALMLGGFAIMVLLDRRVNILVELKYALHLAPAIVLVAAIGLERLVGHGLPAGLFVCVWLVASVWSLASPAFREAILPSTWFFPWREARAAVEARDRPGDNVLVLLPDPSLLAKNYEPLLEYYFDGLDVEPALVAPSPATSDARYTALAREGIRGAERLWLIYDRERRPWRAGPLQDSLLPDEGFAFCGDWSQPSPVSVGLYARHLPEGGQPAATFDNLEVFDLGSGESGGEVLPLVLGFGWRDAPDASLSFAAHLYDAGGQLVGQYDGGLPVDGAFGCRAFDLPLSEVPAGEYRLGLLVYRWATGERLLNADGADVTILRRLTIR